MILKGDISTPLRFAQYDVMRKRHPERSQRIPDFSSQNIHNYILYLSSPTWLGIQFEPMFLDS